MSEWSDGSWKKNLGKKKAAEPDRDARAAWKALAIAVVSTVALAATVAVAVGVVGVKGKSNSHSNLYIG